MTTQNTLHAAELDDWARSRELLRRLREIMRYPGTVQDRLDMVVRMIAGHLGAEVCSIYAAIPGSVLELRATKGLKPESVRRTRLAVGEGLVGNIAEHARTLALAEAQSHPQFAYRPETGEEIYHSFLGVPLLRGGNVKGVLVVQNVEPRSYRDAEIEVCETAAMAVAELIDQVIAAEARNETASSMPERLSGESLNRGIAMGHAVFHQRRIVISRVVAEDPAREIERLGAALVAVESAMSRHLRNTAGTANRESQEILETYLMLVEDRGWRTRMEDAIQGGLTAEAAVQKVQNDTRARMQSISDRYLRERLADLDDIASRLLQQLAGESATPDYTAAKSEGIVLIARNMGPAELLDYDLDTLRAVVLAEGSQTSHVAIVARALDIPVVGRCPGAATQILDGDFVIVDGNTGQVLVRAGENVRAQFQGHIAARAREEARFKALRDLPAETLDGAHIALSANAGLLIDLPHVLDSGAGGIGLYRTEVAFMIRDELPDIAHQSALYARVLDEMAGRPVTFRTLDIGGDKDLPALKLDHQEDNPAMGWRAIRLTLDRPPLLRTQLRAMIRAAAGGQLRVVFPMISEVAEFDAARALLDQELAAWRDEGGTPPAEVKAGAMLEVPALLWQLPALFARVDFVSVGSNDLFQFVFASDRTNPKVSSRYDVLSPPALSLMRDLAARAQAAGMQLTLCGEMAGTPIEAMAAIGCGFEHLSMQPTKLPVVKAMVRSLERAPLIGLIAKLAQGADHSARDALMAFARDTGVEV
jgi:phosphotransferase system enzyme I (PtsP)